MFIIANYSAVYSLFDYRTNDQSLGGLYTKAQFNAPLFAEDAGYVTWFLSDDVSLLEGADKNAAQVIIDGINEVAAPYEGIEEVVSIDESISNEAIAKVYGI